MKKHSDYITHINNSEDIQYLKQKHFDVNMRLFNSSPEYKAIILQQCEYLRMLVLTKMEGYKLPHGMSSANAGLSFNIIAIAQNRGKSNATAKIMINPRIDGYIGDEVITQSNCGSLTLDEPIKVNRNTAIRCCYYDEKGQIWNHVIPREWGAFTIQHEVDHNNGILITDKQSNKYE